MDRENGAENNLAPTNLSLSEGTSTKVPTNRIKNTVLVTLNGIVAIPMLVIISTMSDADTV